MANASYNQGMLDKFNAYMTAANEYLKQADNIQLKYWEKALRIFDAEYNLEMACLYYYNRFPFKSRDNLKEYKLLSTNKKIEEAKKNLGLD